MCGHRVQFYDSKAFLVRKVCDHVAPVLRRGGGVVVIATRPLAKMLEALLAGENGVSERFRCVDAHETLERFMVDGMPDEARFTDAVGSLIAEAAAAGNGQVGAFGEMVAVLYERGQRDAAARLEQLWNGLGSRFAFDLLCAYPMSAFPDQTHRHAFQAVCEAHTHVEPVEQVAELVSDSDRLHRLIARLQQSANSLDRELVQRRRSDRLLNRQAARLLALQRAQAELKDLAGHDALTGLCNRRAFSDCLTQAVSRARRTCAGVALLFIDLDDFKPLNDRHGHDAGDRLLQEVAGRLGRCVRQSDTVCRIGGDEFTIVMEDADGTEAALLAQRVVDALSERFMFGAQAVRVTASVGVSLYPEDGGDVASLLRSADEAMYRAKALGKGHYAVASQEAVPADDGDAAAWMTVEAAALKLHLTRPHVVKLVAEGKFGAVLRRRGALPLLSPAAVERVARELRPQEASPAQA